MAKLIANPLNSSAKPKVAILGAGCAGLAAAWRLARQGFDVEVIEKSSRAGGLAGGIEINGNVYEYGPHTFHTTDPEILADIKSIMGMELVEFNRTIKIKFLGNYFSFPLSIREVIFKLPFKTVVHALISLIWNFLKGLAGRPREENSETLLIRYYGKVLYKLFFRDYIEHVWGIPPSRFSPNFSRQRIPRLDIVRIQEFLLRPIRRWLPKKIRTDHFVEKVEGHLYTTRQGFSLITERIAEAAGKLGAQIRFKTEVVKVIRSDEHVGRIVVKEESGAIQEIPVDGVVNTLPINEFVLMMEPKLEPSVITAARKLRFRALVFVGIHVNRPKVLPASFMYFREYCFNRLTDLAQFEFKIDPPGSTLLVAEINCDMGDRYWMDDHYSIECVIEKLVEEKLIARSEIRECHVYRARHAYPIYELHYEKALGTLLAQIEALSNTETAGRQGRFAYINTHVAMKMGYEAADRLRAKIRGNMK